MSASTPQPPRIEELIAVARGLAMELEATRKQVAFIGEIAQEMLKTALSIKADQRLNH